MTTAYTSLLGLALPVTGELSGTWGDVVNNSITSLLDSAVAGTTTLSTDADVTLTTTTGAANTAREAILLWTAGGTLTRTITAPAQSKIYTVINASSSTQSIKLVGAGPTTGVTILKGESALCAWNGSDFIKISNTAGAGVFSSITNSGLTSGRVVYSTTGGLETDSANLTFNGTTLTANTLNLTNALGTAYGGTGLTSFTANGVVYASSTSALTTGSALTFDGTRFTVVGGNANSLRVDNGGQQYTEIDIANAGTVKASIYWDNTNTNLFYSSNGSATYASGAASYHSWNISSEQMRLTSTGLGIGTSSPAYKLDVAGDIALKNNATYFYSKTSGGSSVRMLGINSGNTAYIGPIDSGPGDAILNASSSSANIQFYASGSEGMRLTSTGLGIGTSSPSAKLVVAGYSSANSDSEFQLNRTSSSTGIGQGPGIRFNDGTTSNTRVIQNGSGNLQFWHYTSSWQTEMTLDSSGNLGLGVTPSASTLPTIQSTYGVISGNTNINIVRNAYYNGGWKYVATAAATQYQQDTGTHAWYNAASGTAGTAITFTQAMTLDSSGRLSVGTTGSVFSGITVQAQASTGGGVGIINDATLNYGRLDFLSASSGGYTRIKGDGRSTGYLSFETNDTERARIDSSGNVGIGTTSPGYKLDAIGTIRSRNASGDAGGLRFWSDVSGNGNIFEYYNASLIFGTNDTEKMRLDSSGNLLVGKTATTGTTAGIVLLSDGTITSARAASTNSNTTLDVYSTGAAAYRFYVGMGGTVYATSTTISAISDIRFKENVRDLDAGLSEVMALKPRLYDWKEGKGANIKNARGFIAQEFETVFPDLIDEWNDPAPEGEEPYKSVRQDLIPVLVKAMQEQQALIESLTKRLADAGIA